MNIAYVRVSSVQQNFDRQIEALEKYNIEKWYKEKTSGKTRERDKLRECLDFVREGDILYVQAFDRLARSVKDLLDIVDLLDKKKVKLISINENLDTTTAAGRMMLQIMAVINEFEIAILKERQLEGIRIAKNKGVYKGRNPISKPRDFDALYERWKRREITSKEFMYRTNLKKSTFYKFLKEKEAQ